MGGGRGLDGGWGLDELDHGQELDARQELDHGPELGAEQELDRRWAGAGWRA